LPTKYTAHHELRHDERLGALVEEAGAALVVGSGRFAAASSGPASTT
jgi:hypothetical protein